MKMNKENFLDLVSDIDTKTGEKNNWRIANRAWLRLSQDIAFDILEKLDELGWSQKELAKRLGVSPQYINKIVKGSENFTLETLIKLQEVLNIPILINYLKEKEQTNKTNKTNIVVILNSSKETNGYTDKKENGLTEKGNPSGRKGYFQTKQPATSLRGSNPTIVKKSDLK